MNRRIKLETNILLNPDKYKNNKLYDKFLLLQNFNYQIININEKEIKLLLIR